MVASSRNLRTDGRPLYAKAVDALFDLVTDGTYRPGQLLPSEEELARQLGVSRSTIRESISHLVKDGLITRRQGVGTFVTERSREQLSGGLERLQSLRTLAALAGMTAQVAEYTLSTVAATPEWAAILQVPEGSELAHLEVIEVVKDCRIAFLDGLIPSSLVDLSDLARYEGSLLDYLLDHTYLELSHTRSEVYALAAGPELARRLGVAEGRSVLHLAETLYSTAGQPIAYLRNYFLTECFNFTIFRRVSRPRRRNAQEPGA